MPVGSPKQFNRLAISGSDKLRDSSLTSSTVSLAAPGPSALPYNPRSAGPVKLVNQLWLASVARACGYRDPRWCTYRQALQMVWQVRRGQKGTPVIVWSVGPGGRPEAHLPLAVNAEECRGADRLERPEPDLWQECL